MWLIIRPVLRLVGFLLFIYFVAQVAFIIPAYLGGYKSTSSAINQYLLTHPGG